ARRRLPRQTRCVFLGKARIYRVLLSGYGVAQRVERGLVHGQRDDLVDVEGKGLEVRLGILHQPRVLGLEVGDLAFKLSGESKMLGERFLACLPCGDVGLDGAKLGALLGEFVGDLLNRRLLLGSEASWLLDSGRLARHMGIELLRFLLTLSLKLSDRLRP